MEAGILSGRFLVLQDLGRGMSMRPPEDAYEVITRMIDNGGVPISGASHQQYWGTTEDWFFKQKGVPGKGTAIEDVAKLDNKSLKASAILNTKGQMNIRDYSAGTNAKQLVKNLGTTKVSLENESNDEDILFLPIQQDEDEGVYYG